MTNLSTDPTREPIETGRTDGDHVDDVDYEALADWAQSPAAAEEFAVAATTSTRAQREALQEQTRALLARSLPQDPAQDTPAEAFTRAELAKTGRGPGRPSLAGTTGGGRSRARQVRLSPELDQRLDAYTQRADMRPSDVMRQALVDYLDAHSPQHKHSA